MDFLKRILFFLAVELNLLLLKNLENIFFSHILKLKKVAKDNKIDFLKCDRYWEDGIEGNIPIIRYIGNAFA